MAGSREARHVEADLRDDDLCGQVTDAGDGPQLLDCLPKGGKFSIHLCIDFGDGRFEPIDLAQMQAQKEAMPLGDAPRSHEGVAAAGRVYWGRS